MPLACLLAADLPETLQWVMVLGTLTLVDSISHPFAECLCVELHH
jgi:hypothetical protein